MLYIFLWFSYFSSTNTVADVVLHNVVLHTRSNSSCCAVAIKFLQRPWMFPTDLPQLARPSQWSCSFKNYQLCSIPGFTWFCYGICFSGLDIQLCCFFCVELIPLHCRMQSTVASWLTQTVRSFLVNWHFIKHHVALSRPPVRLARRWTGRS